jgi:hypothetical protein
LATHPEPEFWLAEATAIAHVVAGVCAYVERNRTLLGEMALQVFKRVTYVLELIGFAVMAQTEDEVRSGAELIVFAAVALAKR